jgi:undecaprenyl-diphosphatase
VSFDEHVLRFLVDHRAAPLDRLARVTMAAGLVRSLVAIEAVVVVVIVAGLRLWRVAFAAGAAVVAASLLAAAGKAAIGRPRPPWALALVHTSGSSMPSTNAAQVAAIATVAMCMLGTRWPRHRATIAGLCVVAVIWVDFCLAYLGTHWATDVAVGTILGSGIGLFVVLGEQYVFRQWRQRAALSAEVPISRIDA